MKKDQNLPKKTFTVIILPDNYFQLPPTILDTNHLIIQTIEDDHLTKEIHAIFHKTDIVDQTVELSNIETTIQDRIQADLNFRLKPVSIHTPGIDTIPMIDLETLLIIEIDIIPAIGIESIQTPDREIDFFNRFWSGIEHLQYSQNLTSKIKTLRNSKQASDITRLNLNKLWKNTTLPCSHSNIGTK